jgi:hypothetical protein
MHAAGLDNLSYGHARPLPYLQTWWAEGKSAGAQRVTSRAAGHLSGRARRDAAMLRFGFTAKPF